MSSATGLPLEISATRQLVPWMREHQVSIALTTYKTGKLFIISPREDGQLSVAERSFPRCMGLWSDGIQIYLSSIFQLWRLRHIPNSESDKHDRVFVPRVAWSTGDIDIHDIALDTTGTPLFVSTLFSCIATVDEDVNFRPLWQPAFISQLAAEDRCHLNGLALRDGEPAFATAVSRSDVADGWREHRMAGGVVMDIPTNDVVVEGLCMPHSPRWHNGRLWLLNSGRAEFGYVDFNSGKFEVVSECLGYPRGLHFIGNYAVVGISTSRHDASFGGLPLHDMLAQKAVSPRCGCMVINIETGEVLHQLRFEGVVKEVYDVSFLPGVTKPHLVGVVSDEIHRLISYQQ